MHRRTGGRAMGPLPEISGGFVFINRFRFGTFFMDGVGKHATILFLLMFLVLVGAVQRWDALQSAASATIALPVQEKTQTESIAVVLSPHSGLSENVTACFSIVDSFATGLAAENPQRILAQIDATTQPAGATNPPGNQTQLTPFDILAETDLSNVCTKALTATDAQHHIPSVRSPALNRIFYELQLREAGRPDHLTEDRSTVSEESPAAPPAAHAKVARTSNDPSAWWPQSRALMAELSSCRDPKGQFWAQHVQSAVDALQSATSAYDTETRQALQELQKLAHEAHRIASGMPSGQDQSNLMIAAYAVRRRADLWQAVSVAADPQVSQQARAISDSIDRREILARISDIRKALRRTAHGAAWSEFLLLDSLESFAATPAVHDLTSRRNVACQALARRDVESTSEKQLAFMKSPLIVALDTELRRWATHPVDMFELLRKLEAYEQNAYARIGQDVTEITTTLRWSSIPAYNKVASIIDVHYRNANLRISVAEEFLNWMIPAVRDMRSPVSERILGAYVSGQSKSRMHMQVDLIDDPDQIRMKMQANGNLAANTRSTSGGVVVHNFNRSSFLIEKPFVMGREGIQTGPAKASANGRSSVLGLQTKYDPFPILGAVVRRVATQKIFETRGLQRRVFVDRVASNVQQQVDTQVQQQLAVAEKEITNQVLMPLGNMHLSPTTISMSSSDNRANYRGRLAGDHQLAAFTARPRDSANNLVSIQVHQSAINNFLRQLRLDGQRGELREVIQSVMNQFDLVATPIPDDIPEGIEIAMAQSDSVRVDCDDDRVSFVLRIAELSTDERTWRNFAVRANYTPTQPDRFRCDLTRETGVELAPRGLSFGDQVALRAIFTKVFSKNRPITLIHPEMTKDPRVKDLQVDQFVARDGWVAISLGQVHKPQQAKNHDHVPSRTTAQVLIDKIRRR